MERSIREEARRLRQGQGGGEAGGAGAAAAGRKNVDLESLAFVQGAHFNSSKQCTLPQVCGGGRALIKPYNPGPLVMALTRGMGEAA